jgi:serine/threonine protein kinase
MTGKTLAHYPVLEKLGQGGMGAVYRARDTKLGRDVALKFLPEEFSRDPERLARFEREARVLASLNHPNIATIHGFEQVDGRRGQGHRHGLRSCSTSRDIPDPRRHGAGKALPQL